MTRVKMTLQHALIVCNCSNKEQMFEWNSLNNIESSRARANELFEYSLISWAILHKEAPVAIFGVYRLSATTVNIWCMTTVNAPRRVWGFMARETREIMKAAFDSGYIKRIHAMVCKRRPEPELFASKLGMEVICDLPDYGDNQDFMLMAATQKGIRL